MEKRSVYTDGRRFRAFGALDDFHRDGLAFGELHDTGALQGGGMDEHILAAFQRCDEAETLAVSCWKRRLQNCD